MGIGPHAIRLTRLIFDAKILPRAPRILELGSQDFAPDRTTAQHAISREFGFSDTESIHRPSDLYKRLGCAEYVSIDMDEALGAKPFDLNFDLRDTYGFGQTFDLVTNHGTTEHLFNQQQVFQTVHDLTARSGIMVHALPFQGYQNHGMFNYNPSLFLDLAIANDYDVLGLFLNIDDELYDYDEDFLRRNAVPSTDDVLVLSVLRRTSERDFAVPYDGRYFAVTALSDATPLDQVGTTRRLGQLMNEVVLRTGSQQSPDAGFRIITPVWGRSYAQIFTEMSLPSQMASGNLGIFSRGEAVYTIVTTAEEMKGIQRSSSFAALEKMMDVEFILHDEIQNEDPYVRMTRCYNLALGRLKRPQVCLFLTADDFYSDGLFRTVRQMTEAGRRVVMVPTLRVILETFWAELQSRDVHTLPSRQLVPLLLKHEHPMTTSCVINCATRLLHALPAETLFRKKDGYVGRWNVMHPLAIRVSPPAPTILSTIDWNYPLLNVAEASDIHIIRDSDEGFVASTTPLRYAQGQPISRHATRRHRIRNLKEWLNIGWALNFHTLQYSEPVYVHANELDAEWQVGLTELDRICSPFGKYIRARESELVPLHMRHSPAWLLSCAITSVNWVTEGRRRFRVTRRRLRRNSLAAIMAAIRGLAGRYRRWRRRSMIQGPERNGI